MFYRISGVLRVPIGETWPREGGEERGGVRLLREAGQIALVIVVAVYVMNLGSTHPTGASELITGGKRSAKSNRDKARQLALD
jgi:hypothetical protein